MVNVGAMGLGLVLFVLGVLSIVAFFREPGLRLSGPEGRVVLILGFFAVGGVALFVVGLKAALK